MNLQSCHQNYINSRARDVEVFAASTTASNDTDTSRLLPSQDMSSQKGTLHRSGVLCKIQDGSLFSRFTGSRICSGNGANTKIRLFDTVDMDRDEIAAILDELSSLPLVAVFTCIPYPISWEKYWLPYLR